MTPQQAGKIVRDVITNTMGTKAGQGQVFGAVMSECMLAGLSSNDFGHGINYCISNGWITVDSGKSWVTVHI